MPLPSCSAWEDRKSDAVSVLFADVSAPEKQFQIVRLQETPPYSRKEAAKLQKERIEIERQLENCKVQQKKIIRQEEQQQKEMEQLKTEREQLGNSELDSGDFFPTEHSWKEFGKVENFFLRGKGERLWSGKGKFVENFVENPAAWCRTLHRLWKSHSTILHSRFHTADFPAMQMNC